MASSFCRSFFFGDSMMTRWTLKHVACHESHRVHTVGMLAMCPLDHAFPVRMVYKRHGKRRQHSDSIAAGSPQQKIADTPLRTKKVSPTALLSKSIRAGK